MNTTNAVVAETILEQLGGRMFLMMVGGKDLMYGENSLHVRLGGGCKQGINRLVVTLDASDTYTMAFLKVRAGKVTTVVEVEGVYNDSLREIFTRYTGFATSL
jgi:hypothetical protein